jgi:hypothetical protein
MLILIIGRLFMTIIDFEERVENWFEMDGGGRVQIRALTPDDFRDIERQATKKRVEFKKVEGVPARFDVVESNEDLKNELFWDRVIVSWENLFDRDGKEITCTKENKVMLMLKVPSFASFVADSMSKLIEDRDKQKEIASKN